MGHIAANSDKNELNPGMQFGEITTRRVVIRRPRLGDERALYERRNDPDVARYQNWVVPFPEEDARSTIAETAALAGPEVDEWWMAIIADAVSGETLGDLVLHLTWGGRSAEIGYTLHREHWGKGIATEALEALVEWLFDQPGVTRVFGMIDPANLASARVLERTGFVFEAHTRSSFWKGDEVSDDHIYAMLRTDWEAWTKRPRWRPHSVRLVEVSVDNERSVSRLKTHKTQERFVAPVAASFVDALFPEAVDGARLVPWMRAVEADGDLVGFVMLAEMTAHHPDPYLWRFLVDRLHQRRGIGSVAMDLVEAQCREWGATAVTTSWVPGRGSPEPFYLGRAFRPTGRVIDGEIEGRKELG